MSFECIKSDPGGKVVIDQDGNYLSRWTVGSKEIKYDAGPKYKDNHCFWKRCSQVELATPQGNCATTLYREYPTGKLRTWNCKVPGKYAKEGLDRTSVGSHSGAALQAAVDSLHEKLDLNCQDRVMGYSYALDLIPLFGPFLKASSILNKIGRWAASLGRNLRKRPFTTVIREAAQADLLNRFVIQTTIQDTKHILDVYDRCVRTFTTAHRRNVEKTVLSGTSTNVSYGAEYTSQYVLPQNPGDAYGSVLCRSRRGTTAKVVAVMELYYNTEQADPARWVAHALGIDTPLESLWDKIPFSFVVDYFFRVGEFIDTIGDRYGQDALRAKVLSVHECWAMLKTYNDVEWTPGSAPYMNRWRGTITGFTGSNGCCGSRRFDRYPIALMDSSGFWDKGGFWSPSLSSVRQRTLLELFLVGSRRGS